MGNNNCFAISYNGDLLPCSKIPKYSLGNILKNDINTLINTEKLKKLRFIFQGISLLLFGSLNNFIGGIISLIILGIALGITGIYINTIVQEEIPNEILGRCISVIMIISNISVPMGYLIGGYVINFIKLNLILIFSGFIILVCGIISFFILKKISVEKNIPA
ncbi:SPASM domain-containing protein [Clostridium faecium]|uniref:MFS transporter n=1 Tax=Clostridium faecium TaxID=2762223 RepID=A0ABR8YVQ5_9CLOT|nr:SPASM domain-containing protein [Clostridium faecium]MBD8048367.1 MFS transporter [Clostridium faecium]